MIICPKCNKQLEDGTQFCDACGENLTVQQSPAPDVSPAPEAAVKPAFDIKKIAVIGVAAIAVIALVIFIGSLLFGGGEPDYALYIKDGEVVFSDFKKPFEITEELADDVENSQLASYASELGYYTYLTEDGKKLFYLDEIGADGGVLYYRNASKPKAEPTKIDSDIRYFMVNESGNLVTYIKDGTLYQHNLKDKTKIKGDVDVFIASLDGKKIIYQTDESDLYIKNGKKDAEKIASEVDDVIYVDKAFSKIYYEKGNAVYLKSGSKDAEKLCSDVYSVLEFYETGEFYYVEGVDEEEGEGDTATQLPTEVSDIIDNMVEQSTRKLVYYNGKEKKTVADNYLGDYRVSADKQVIAYKTVSASDISEEDYMQGIDAFAKWSIAIEDKATEIDLDDINGVRVAKNGKSAYVWTVEKEDEKEEEGSAQTVDEEAEAKTPTATLYKMKLSDKAEKPEKIDEDVYPYGISVTSAGNVIYFKEVKDEEGELYVDKKKIDDDVKLYSTAYLKDSKKVLYYNDWDAEKSKGTLKIATLNGKSTKVGDDVAKYTVTPNEDILFLTEYKNNKGELYRFSGSKAKKLDDDVVGILSYTSYTNRVASEFGWIKD